MKFFHRKFLVAFLFLGLAFNAKAVNDTLTTAQAFNWKAGDTLIFSGLQYEGKMIPPAGQTVIIPMASWQNIFVVNYRADDTTAITFELRNLSLNDTVSLRLADKDSLVKNFKGFNGTGIAELGGCDGDDHFSGCDTMGFNCDVSYGIDTSLNDAAQVSLRNMFFESGNEIVYEAGLGIVYFGFSWLQVEGDWFGCDYKLIHYSSDSIQWNLYNSISEPTTSPSFHLSPNPANDEITITTETENGTPFEAYINDITGNCVLAHKNIFQNKTDINVGSLLPGYYFLKLTYGHSLSAMKGFVIAR